MRNTEWCTLNASNAKKWQKICQFMLKVCPYKCKESSDLNFRGKLEAIHSAYLIINIVFFSKKMWYQYFNDILKWRDNCITIYRQTIFWGLVRKNPSHTNWCWFVSLSIFYKLVLSFLPEYILQMLSRDSVSLGSYTTTAGRAVPVIWTVNHISTILIITIIIIITVYNNHHHHHHLQSIPQPRHSIVRQQGIQGRRIHAEWPTAPSLVIKVAWKSLTFFWTCKSSGML